MGGIGLCGSGRSGGGSAAHSGWADPGFDGGRATKLDGLYADRPARPTANLIFTALASLRLRTTTNHGAPEIPQPGPLQTRLLDPLIPGIGNGPTGHGNRYLARALGEAAAGAARTNTFLGERYRRIARRRGKKKAIVAVCRSIVDLGLDYYDHRGGTQRAVRNHIRGLQNLGYQVTLQAAA